MNPRKTKQWRFLNESDYKSKLKPEDRAWLDQFDSYHWKNRSGADVMEIADELLINTSSEEVIDTPSSKDVFSSITSDDIRMYFAKKEKGLSLRQLAAEFNITKSTALNKINLVERLLKEVSFEVLSEHLKELKDQRETERPS